MFGLALALGACATAAPSPALIGDMVARHRQRALELKKASLYEYGKTQLEEGSFDDSYRAFSQLTKLDAQYKDAAALLADARSQAIQHHYSEGISFYRDEQIEAAIAQWRTVLEYDPQHADARKNINQAERILRALHERQRKP